MNTENLHFYTDRSLKNLQTPTIQSGIGWIYRDNTLIKFNAATQSYPDATRIELEAILSLLIAIPSNIYINIYIDNTTAINNLQTSTTAKQIQLKNWDIIHYINYLKKSKKITTIMHKIKSHSTNLFYN